MYSAQVRQAFEQFFSKNNHLIMPSSSLVPKDDPTLMFTNAGMNQFKDIFTGLQKPLNGKIATSQKCVRAGGKHNDLENVGYTARHHTFFEMLGNFSFGDYFKDVAIELAWKFLTEELKLDKSKLYITIYHNDDEAGTLWKKIAGFTDEKIIKIYNDNNFWSMGDVGPCGPCSEIFYDHGDKYQGGLPGTPEEDGDRYIEIWNLVFMQFQQMQDGSRVNLPKPCIDTGMGLERITAVVQGTNHNYETDIFKSIINSSMNLSKNSENITSHRVVADHLRSCSFLIADGVVPSNEGRGYILRRIMRRAMRHILQLSKGYNQFMMSDLVPTLVEVMGGHYQELVRAQSLIESVLTNEEERFRSTLESGMNFLNKEMANCENKIFDGAKAFKLYDTYGFPLDLTQDVLRAHEINVDLKRFEEEMAQQKERARASWKGSGENANDEVWYKISQDNGSTEFLGYSESECAATVLAIVHNNELVDSVENSKCYVITDRTVFYAESGGQVGDVGLMNSYEISDTKKFLGKTFGHLVAVDKLLKVGDVVNLKVDSSRRSKIKANHSATHLLHHVLRKHFGDSVTQKGSIVTDEKLRFDFSFHKALTKSEIALVEEDVNNMIVANNSVNTKILNLEDARKQGAMALFGEKYEDDVRTVFMGESIELCGGTHVKSTGDIGLFKIVSEGAIASGVRRIEAATGIAALKFVSSKIDVLEEACQIIKCSDSDLGSKIKTLIDDKKKVEKQLEDSLVKIAESSETQSFDYKNFKLKVKVLRDCDNKTVSKIKANEMSENCVVVVLNFSQNNIFALIGANDLVLDSINASDISNFVSSIINGKGGGNKTQAQTMGENNISAEELLEKIREYCATAKAA